MKPGDYVIKRSDLGKVSLSEILKGTGVWATITDKFKPGALAEIRLPQLAIYQSFLSSMDEGWTRWILDEFEFKYTIIHNKDFLSLISHYYKFQSHLFFLQLQQIFPL